MAAGGVTFLFDNNLSPALPRAFEALGESAFHVRDVLGPRTPDEVWLEYAGNRGWCIVTQDHEILRRPLERAALTSFSVGAFFLAKGITGHCRITQALVRHWPEVKRYARSSPKPFLVSINERGLRPIR